MKIREILSKISFEFVLTMAAFAAILNGQLMLSLMLMGLRFVWEDSKWPAFDSANYDQKMMMGPLKPWDKGN